MGSRIGEVGVGSERWPGPGPGGRAGEVGDGTETSLRGEGTVGAEAEGPTATGGGDIGGDGSAR